MTHPTRMSETFKFKRTFVLLLACVLALAGVMQQRVSSASLGTEGKAPVQRIYEEIEHSRVQDLRSHEQRQGLKPAERPLPLRRLAPLNEAPLTTAKRLPAAPRAPPHQPRAPPLVA